MVCVAGGARLDLKEIPTMPKLRMDRLTDLARRLRERARVLRGEIRETLLRSEHEHHKDHQRPRGRRRSRS